MKKKKKHPLIRHRRILIIRSDIISGFSISVTKMCLHAIYRTRPDEHDDNSFRPSSVFVIIYYYFNIYVQVHRINLHVMSIKIRRKNSFYQHVIRNAPYTHKYKKKKIVTNVVFISNLSYDSRLTIGRFIKIMDG